MTRGREERHPLSPGGMIDAGARGVERVLLSRARELLAEGPATAARLIEHVCQLPGAPSAVAEHMAVALFEGVDGFARTADGRWTLGGATAASLPENSAQGTVTLGALEYAVVDVETTGMSPWHGDRVTEVAAVIVRNGEIADVFETLVNPERSIPPFITALTSITWEMVREAPIFADVAGSLSRVLAGRVFVAHNAAFDWRFLTSEYERTGARLQAERLCTVRLARALLPMLRRRSLDALAAHFGISNAGRHRAAGDAVATAQVLIRLLSEAQSRGCITLDDVGALTRPSGRRSHRPSAMPGWSDGAPSA